MWPIAMVDLKSQYQKIKPEVDQAIQEVIDSTQFIKGDKVKEFQDKLSNYLGCKHTIACANGTDALQIAMMALGLKPGDEVITTNFTFIATVEVIALLGLKPVLVDVHPNTFNIDIKAIKEAITPNTKAIVPVHLFGQCANMEAVMEIANEYGLFVIEDNAQAIGGDYIFEDGKTQKAGTIGHVGCTSFFPSKNLGCFGDGGALFTNDDALAVKISCIVNHGMEKRYYHDRIGVNSRLDTIQAAILNIKLPLLDNYINSRQLVAQFYNKAFSELDEVATPVTASFTNHVFHQYTLKIKNGKRDALKKWLDEKSVPAMIYYPIPLHLQKAFEDYKEDLKIYPITEQLCEEVISLPMHTELDEEQLNYIAESVISFFKQ
ncbi:MAG: DegT/DnrJ/EryC1/StrS family aminotransferase [Salinivirgaceae bacterium]|jgi:UDP-2-acetamido-2-deoxy-ribo-hexuluronate aminotransferase|nr:DegT/DnrJ/EryC1/StrS family aminotransferase [Salinivirgaceae bacterium]